MSDVDGKLYLDIDGKTKEYIILLTFVSNNKNYIVYTENETDEDGFIKTYVGEYVKKNNIEKLIPVEDEEILSEVDKILAKIDGEDSKK